MDTLICRDLVYDCRIGFHECEKTERQPLHIDLEVSVSPIPKDQFDSVSAIRFDYYKANERLQHFFSQQRQLNLIESVAENVAELLLREFAIEAILVRVSKRPMDIPNIACVAYECRRRNPI